MSGTVVSVGIAGCAVLLCAGALTAGQAAVASQRAAASADAAALAAADTVTGLHPGDPCVRAAAVASRGGANLDDCSVDGLVATVIVTVTVSVAPWGAARAQARAGPPP